MAYTRNEIKEMWNYFIDDNIIKIKVSNEIGDLFSPEKYEGDVYFYIKNMQRYVSVTQNNIYKVRDIILHYVKEICDFNFNILVIIPEADDSDIVDVYTVYDNGRWLI